MKFLRDIIEEKKASAVMQPTRAPASAPVEDWVIEEDWDMPDEDDEVAELEPRERLAHPALDAASLSDVFSGLDDASTGPEMGLAERAPTAEPEPVAWDEDEYEDETPPGPLVLRSRVPDAELSAEAELSAMTERSVEAERMAEAERSAEVERLAEAGPLMNLRVGMNDREEPGATVTDAAPTANPAWDFDDDVSDDIAPVSEQAVAAPVPAAETPQPPAPVKVNTGRAKTRLLGFTGLDSGDDPFAAKASSDSRVPTQFPVGWLVVVEGPGRGAAFSLHNGVAQIGRGEDQTIRLDFGDTAISRENHAAIAFDEEQNGFFLGHGGKANLVRCNGQPVLSTQALSPGDTIRIGETTLRLVPLCGPDFRWSE